MRVRWVSHSPIASLEHPLISKFAIFKAASAVALVALSSASYAGPVAYTSLSSFLAATFTPATDGFDDLSISDLTPGPLSRNAGPYSYTASATSGGNFFGAGSDPDHWLSTNIATDSLTFSNFSVPAVGGFFFGTDVFGLFAPGSIILTASDASGTTTQTILDATPSSFLGFVSTGSLMSLTVTAIQPTNDFLWPTANNMILAVPEPSTPVLMLAGLGLLAAVARRGRRGAATSRVEVA